MVASRVSRQMSVFVSSRKVLGAPTPWLQTGLTSTRSIWSSPVGSDVRIARVLRLRHLVERRLDSGQRLECPRLRLLHRTGGVRPVRGCCMMPRGMALRPCLFEEDAEGPRLVHPSEQLWAPSTVTFTVTSAYPPSTSPPPSAGSPSRTLRR